MGRYLLDTHAAMWFLNGDNSISETAKSIILDLSNDKCVSIVSAWEIAIKIGLGKLDFNGRATGFIELAQSNGFAVLPIKAAHLGALESLPLLRRDPFDRLLAATALAERMTLVTRDRNIARYAAPKIW